MNSTGNDIVALQLINAERTRRKSFYSKILCQTEVSFYEQNNFSSLSFENYVWLLWSVKESVYKFCKRHNPQLLFSPTNIILQKLDLPAAGKNPGGYIAVQEELSFLKEACYCSQVSCGLNTWRARSFITDELIFTVVNDENDFQHIYWGIKPIDDDTYDVQAEAVRSFTLNKLKKILPGNDFHIKKNAAGYPEIVQYPHIKISFAHHGKFVAYSLRLN